MDSKLKIAVDALKNIAQTRTKSGGLDGKSIEACEALAAIGPTDAPVAEADKRNWGDFLTDEQREEAAKVGARFKQAPIADPEFFYTGQDERVKFDKWFHEQLFSSPPKPVGPFDAWQARAALTAKPAEAVTKCQYCDNTGDVHSPTGEWRGECTECNSAAPEPRVFRPTGYGTPKEPSQAFAYASRLVEAQLKEAVAKPAAEAIAPTGGVTWTANDVARLDAVDWPHRCETTHDGNLCMYCGAPVERESSTAASAAAPEPCAPQPAEKAGGLRQALIDLRALHISTMLKPTHFNAYLNIIDKALADSPASADALAEPQPAQDNSGPEKAKVDFLEHLQKSSEIVRYWPKWKGGGGETKPAQDSVDTGDAFNLALQNYGVNFGSGAYRAELVSHINTWHAAKLAEAHKRYAGVIAELTVMSNWAQERAEKAEAELAEAKKFMAVVGDAIFPAQPAPQAGQVPAWFLVKWGLGDCEGFPTEFSANRHVGKLREWGNKDATITPLYAAPPASAAQADPIVELNVALLRKRSAVGIAKYGTTLADNPLELAQWLNHALEESLDQANYLQAAIQKLNKNENK